MADRGPREVTEQDLERVLGGLAGAARVFRLQIEDARQWIEVLADDYPPAEVLLQSLAVAGAQRPLLLGTARHIETAVVEMLRDLHGR